jgi:hypothetical protein
MTSNPAVNTVFGLPGPMRTVTQSRRLVYCGFEANAYTPGVGCP